MDWLESGCGGLHESHCCRPDSLSNGKWTDESGCQFIGLHIKKEFLDWNALVAGQCGIAITKRRLELKPRFSGMVGKSQRRQAGHVLIQGGENWLYIWTHYTWEKAHGGDPGILWIFHPETRIINQVNPCSWGLSHALGTFFHSSCLCGRVNPEERLDRMPTRMQRRAAGRWETEHWVCYYRNQGDLAGQRWTRQRRGTSRFWQELSLLAIWRYFTSKAFVVSPDLKRFLGALQSVIPPGSTLRPTTPSCQCHNATQLVINARRKGCSGGVSSQRGNLS